jgi:hypothetical protein
MLHSSSSSSSSLYIYKKRKKLKKRKGADCRGNYLYVEQVKVRSSTITTKILRIFKITGQYTCPLYQSGPLFTKV